MRLKKITTLLAGTVVFILLTVLTQIGGLIFVIGLIVNEKLNVKRAFYKFGVMLGLYFLGTYLMVPVLAGLFGRERIVTTQNISPTNYMTVFLNRNYVRPELNHILLNAEKSLKGTGIEIGYLDASFPFVDGFPLLPHLSHKDGKKLDISLMYENELGELTNDKVSVSGYGVFEEANDMEIQQTSLCKAKGYFQYDYPKYLTLGRINENLKYSNKGTRQLVQALLSDADLGKMFIEPHLKQRLKINDSRIAFHGCRAVRHDDHIHIQLR
ncbi:MAG: hypothetical protein ABJF04_12265 [Reichenbachiella sp.]|uniref:hypothetical protein n=2 Tax=Reichenbachiella sp. TaxID=2184521 RepID=UPI003265684B